MAGKFVAGHESATHESHLKTTLGLLLLACAILSSLGPPDGAVRAALTDEIEVYDAEINEVGRLSDRHNNFTAIGHYEPDFSGGIAPNHTLNGVPEWACGDASPLRQ